MKRYVLCVAETNNGEFVVLEKTKPAWQAGLLNFPGGKIEDFDKNPAAAARREFAEETGVDYEDWQYRGVFHREEDFSVHVFYAKDDIFKKSTTTTDEEVFLVDRTWILAYPNQFMENFIWELQIASDLAIEEFNVRYRKKM